MYEEFKHRNTGISHRVHGSAWKNTPLTGLCVSMAMHNHQQFTVKNRKRKKVEKLTFVAIGNRSQAKEEEGEEIHSVHLKEERVEDKRVGERKENREEGWGYSSCFNNRSAVEGTVQ